MSISFKCPVCNSSYDNIENVEFGQRVECAVCSSKFIARPSYEQPIIIERGGNLYGLGRTNVNTSNNEETEKIVISFDDIPTSESKTQLDSGRKLSPRQRRLFADAKMMYEHFCSFPYIKLIETNGDANNPPDKYIVEYNVKGIERIINEQIIYRYNHRVEINLPGTYPRTQPICRMLTPIFHPNIEPAVICIGDHWTAGERLCDLVVRIGEMITYQSYNIKSPLDGEAAMWADLHESLLPIDKTDLMPPEL